VLSPRLRAEVGAKVGDLARRVDYGKYFPEDVIFLTLSGNRDRLGFAPETVRYR
jgi:hypothetical protein